MSWGAQHPTEIEQGFFSGSPRMQSGMFVILCSTIFNYCNFNRYIYIRGLLRKYCPTFFSSETI